MVLKVIYSDLDDNQVSKDLDDRLCIRALWRKVVQNAPASASKELENNVFPRFGYISCGEGILLALKF